MKHKIQSVPELLVETYGNQSELARRLGINRGTLREFLYDNNCRRHVVLNGVFMNIPSSANGHKVYQPAKPTVSKAGRKPYYKEGESGTVVEAKELARKMGFL